MCSSKVVETPFVHVVLTVKRRALNTKLHFSWLRKTNLRLREGIKLKIPPELLHKKGMKSQEQSQARLEEVQADDHEAIAPQSVKALGPRDEIGCG